MGIRRRWPDITRRHGRTLLGFTTATLAALLGFIIVPEAEQFASALADIAAALLTVLAFGARWAMARASGAGATDRFTVGMVFVVRNVAIATAIAVTVLGRVEFAVFATAYFLAQVPILLAAVLVFRCVRITDGNNLAGTDRLWSHSTGQAEIQTDGQDQPGQAPRTLFGVLSRFGPKATPTPRTCAASWRKQVAP
jgi:hypothetical protein